MEKKFISAKISEVAKNVKHIPSHIKIAKAYLVDNNKIIEGVVVEGEHIEYTLKLIKDELPYNISTAVDIIGVGKKTSILENDAKRIQRMVAEELEYRTPIHIFKSVVYQHNGITNYCKTR